MILAVVGCRDFQDLSLVEKVLQNKKDTITEIVTGGTKSSIMLARKHNKHSEIIFNKGG